MTYPLHPGETFDDWLARVQPLRRVELDGRIRAAGIRPLSHTELAAWPTLFATAREHAAFLSWLRDERRRHDA